MTPITKDYRGSKAPGALFAIILTLAVNAALFATLGWVNHRPDKSPSSDTAQNVRLLNIQTVSPPKLKPEPVHVPRNEVQTHTSKPPVRFKVQARRPAPGPPPLLSQQVTVDLNLPELDLKPMPVIPASRSETVAEAGTTEADDGALALKLFDDRVDLRPHAVYSPYPRYPYTAQKFGHTGKVTVSLTVTKNGSVRNSRIEHSSGHRSLDQSALRTIRNWRFTPAEADGAVVEVCGEVDFEFELKSQ